MKNWSAKKIILQIVLPALIALGLILGLSIGIPLVMRKNHEGEKNNVSIVIRYTHPFIEKEQIPTSGVYDNTKYIKYWDFTDKKEELVPYDADYKEIYKVTRDVTLGDLMDDLNKSNHNMLFKFTPSIGMGRYVNSYLRPGQGGKYTPEWPNGYILSSSPTNPKNVPDYDKTSNSLPNLLSVGIDSTYIQTNDIFYINFWHN